MWCVDCETIDDYFFEQTSFWFFLPTLETADKPNAYSASSQFGFEKHNSHCVSIAVPRARIKTFVTGLAGAVTAAELGGSKLTTTAGGAPGLEEVARIIPASVLLNRYQGQWVVDALDGHRYESWFQPIVHAANALEQPKPFAHEALFRMRDEDDNIMPPGFVFSLADNSDLLFALDLAARRSAVECAGKSNLKGKIFINFNPSSIYDPSYCLRSTAAAIAECGFKPSDIVFEITETHQIRDMNHLRGILAFYRNAGFGIALDDIGSGWSGLNLLKDVRPDFIKVDMDLIRDIDSDPFKQSILGHLIALARSNGIKVITEGVETEAEARWLIEAESDFLQGFFFGKPTPLQGENKLTTGPLF